MPRSTKRSALILFAQQSMRTVKFSRHTWQLAEVTLTRRQHAGALKGCVVLATPRQVTSKSHGMQKCRGERRECDPLRCNDAVAVQCSG
eukprot:60921-Pleurochrysis_carterae.AAC.2